MKLKLSQIVNGYSALMAVGTEKMPIKPAYSLQRNMRLLQPEAEQFEKTRVDLIKTKYGKQGDGDSYTVSADQLPAFQKQIEELLSVEIDVDVHTIKIVELSDKFEISPVALMNLDWMFTNGETPEASKKPRRRAK